MKRSLLLILIILSTTSYLSAQVTTTFEFSNLLLSHDDNYTNHVEPTLAIGQDGTLFVGYKNAFIHNGPGVRVSFTKSTDNGETWSYAEDMEHFFQDSGQSDPWMVIYESTLYYAYLEYAQGQSQMTMASTSNAGDTWNIVTASNNIGFADKETFTIDHEGNIYLVYDDVLENKTDVRLSRSFDGGQTFIDNVTLQDHISDGYVGPYIVAGLNSGELFVSWSLIKNEPTESDIFIDKSTDYGNTWGQDKDINPTYNASWFTVYEERPSKVTLSVLEQDQKGRIYILWADISSDIDKLDYDVWMKWSDDNAITWSKKKKVNVASANDQWMIDGELDSEGNLHMVYYDNSTSDGYHVKYRVYYPSTNTFSEEITVTQEPTPPHLSRPGDYLTIKLDAENTPHVVWSDGRIGIMDIYYGKLVEKTTTKQRLVIPWNITALVTLILFSIHKNRKVTSY